MAVDPGGIEHTGFGFVRNYELAVSVRRADDRLRRREPVRTGAQQQVVCDSGDITCQWSGNGGLSLNACRRYFYWPGHRSAGP